MCGNVLPMDEQETWGQAVRRRVTAIGIADRDFAARAGVDRGTVARATNDDPKISERTRSKIDRALEALEDELGMAESGGMVTSTVVYKGARFTMQGSPDDVARAIRKVLGED